MAVATLTSKGQITLPKEIREQLKLQPGDRVEFLVGPDGRITVWPVTSDVTILKGLIPKPKQPVTREAMRAAIKQRGGRPYGASIRMCSSGISFRTIPPNPKPRRNLLKSSALRKIPDFLTTWCCVKRFGFWRAVTDNQRRRW